MYNIYLCDDKQQLRRHVFMANVFIVNVKIQYVQKVNGSKEQQYFTCHQI